jgi:hypothetical protein
MVDDLTGLVFEQLHIDVARNSTDDFNPFHDPQRFADVANNPFGATIALGFQTEFLVSDRIERVHRRIAACPESSGLRFSNYEFRFVGALSPGERFDVELRKTVDKTSAGGGLSTRVVLRKHDGKPVLMGSQSDTRDPRFLFDSFPGGLPVLAGEPDRQNLPGQELFLKRKFMTTSNGKNFVVAGLGRQHDYFDELSEKVSFPPLFSASLSSCALLEQAWSTGYDFLADPVVYTTHQISIDRVRQAALRSNDRLHLLVDGPLPARDDGLRDYRVFGLTGDDMPLFAARVQLARLG